MVKIIREEEGKTTSSDSPVIQKSRNEEGPCGCKLTWKLLVPLLNFYYMYLLLKCILENDDITFLIPIYGAYLINKNCQREKKLTYLVVNLFITMAVIQGILGENSNDKLNKHKQQKTEIVHEVKNNNVLENKKLPITATKKQAHAKQPLKKSRPSTEEKMSHL